MRVEAHPTDTEVELLIPEDDEPAPEFSLVVPALNEARTIEEFCRWCQEGLATAGVRGEIIIVDSSTDETPQLALANGARVLRTPRRGLGRAYIDAIPVIRGKYVIMGDVDCTYDFRELEPFVEGFRGGAEYVMGSRWRGSIEKGAMPPLHQYFGTPVTTWILNRLYGSRFTDIHCGMRGITIEALKRMNLSSQSWEYASELVLKSAHLDLKTTEVPVTFYKDREGRLSHHKRSGWYSPFQAAWINLRAMFVYGADFFLIRPGIATLILGLLLTLCASLGPVTLGPITFSLFWQLLGLTLAISGLQSTYLGLLVRTFYDWDGRSTARVLDRFRYTRTVLASMGVVALGAALTVPLVAAYLGGDAFTLSPDIEPLNHLAVTGLMLVLAGFVTFTFTLVLHASAQPGLRARG